MTVKVEAKNAFFKRASKVRKNFKICIYGGTGSGKTILALTFPGLRYIDMEGGVDWYIGRKVLPEQHDDFMLLQTSKAAEVLKAIDAIEAEIIEDPTLELTVVIDPVTVLWEAIQNGFMEMLKKRAKTPQQKADVEIKFQQWRKVKTPYKNAITKLINMPVNLVLVGREGYIYEMKGGELIQVGTKIATEKDTPYIADIYLRAFKEKDTKGVVHYYMEIEKDRTNLLKEGAVVENLTYKKLYEMARAEGLVGPAAGPYNPDKMQSEESIAAEDAAIFEEKKVEESDTEALINDEQISKLYKELGWTPGKVRATMVKEKLNNREALGKFLAELVREKRKDDNDDKQSGPEGNPRDGTSKG